MRTTGQGITCVLAIIVVLSALAAGCSGDGSTGAASIAEEDLAEVVEMGRNTYGVDNPSVDEWRRITTRLCDDTTMLEELPDLVRSLGLVRGSVTEQDAVSSVWPIWGIACSGKVAQIQANR